jgi:type I restriction enzyme S subunit
MIPEDWSYRPLSDLAAIKRGKFSVRPRNDPRYFGGKTPFVQTGDVVGAKGTLTTFTQTLNDAGVAVSKVFPAGTILMTIAANIGDTAIAAFPVACPDSVVGIEPYQAHTDTLWLRAALDAKKKDLHAQAPQNAQKNINLEVLRPLLLLTPPLREQRRIAEILSTWDRAIETVDALIANAREQKSALMQVLLTGRARLPGFGGEWTTTTIGAVCDQVTERAGEAVNLPVLSCSKHDGFVESLKYFKKKIFSDDLSAYKVVRRGMIAFPTNHVEEGSIARQDLVDAGLVSPIYCVFQPVAVDGPFLIRLLKTDAFTQHFAAATNASVDRRGSLRWKEFSKLCLELPPLREQRAIADMINAADGNERILANQRDALRQEKIALMQQLLTGKRRVNTTESEAA